MRKSEGDKARETRRGRQEDGVRKKEREREPERDRAWPQVERGHSERGREKEREAGVNGSSDLPIKFL